VVVHGPAVVALLVPSLLGLLALAVLVHLLARRWEEPAAARRLLYWTMFAFVTHLVLGLIVTSGGELRQFAAPDAQTYHTQAVNIVRHWTESFPAPALPAGKEGFYYLLAGLYWLFGAHPVAGLAVNAAMGAALVPLLSDITHRLFGAEAARRAAPLVVLFPGVLLWTSQLLKEAGVLLFLVLALGCAVRLSERFSIAPVVGMTVSLSLLFTFRAPIALVAAAGLVGGLVVGGRQAAGGVTVAATVLALIAAMVVALGVGRSGYMFATSTDLSQANVVRQDLSTSATTGFDAEADISSPGRALAYLPRGLATFVVGPFPWQITGARQLVLVPEMLTWWVLLPSLWHGLRFGRRAVGRRLLVVLLPAALMSLLLALVVGNLGTMVRERLQVIVVIIPIIALGWSRRTAAKPVAPTPVDALSRV
jgi:hypothetical protein